jgi:hypothetical protein
MTESGRDLPDATLAATSDVPLIAGRLQSGGCWLSGPSLSASASRNDDGCMPGTLDQKWDWMLGCAREFDESCADRSQTWPPPIMTALVMAAAATGLRRFYPFTSHQLLRFATSPEWYLGEGAVAPGCIDLAADPDRYIVWSGQLFHEPLRNILETVDAVAAVRELDRLLAGWPES